VNVFLACAALLTLAVFGFAVLVAVRIIRERRTWRQVRQGRPRVIQGGAQSDAEEENDVAACLQVWLDERWNDRFG
jgi:hypothetical protein